MTFFEQTSPCLPDGDAPLSAADVAVLLKGVPQNLILIGGQALAFWLSYYKININGESAVTSDADFLGDISGAKHVASLLSGILVIPPKHARTAIVAQVRIPVPNSSLKKILIFFISCLPSAA